MLDCETGEGTESTIGDGVGLYWKYEKWLRRNESAVWSTLGATGAMYALRRSLWRPLPANTLLDDVLAPMRAVLMGYRIVFEERAMAFDRAAADAGAESRRKTRTLAGNYQILGQEPRLLLPFVNPSGSSTFRTRSEGSWCRGHWSPHSCRVRCLLRRGWLYAAALTVQVGFYGLAVVGACIELRDRRRPHEFDGMSVPLSKGAR